ncbi:hypothetical protein OKW23_000311 [Bacilli bacterium PM5-9]|nr:hypothetical protein [Bacilli bacterium PM5-9]
MKKLKGISFIFVLIVLFASSINATQTDCDRYTVCPIYDKNTKTLKVYGKNDVGQLGVDRSKDYYYKEEAILVNDLLPNKEKIIAYKNLKDNVIIITDDNKVYVSGNNNFGQVGRSSVKNIDEFQLVSYLSKYKIINVNADLDNKYNAKKITYIIRNKSEDNIEYIDINSNQKFVYVYTNMVIKDKKTYDYEYTYNVNNNYLFKKNNTITSNVNPAYKGFKNKVKKTNYKEIHDKLSKKLTYKRINKSFANTKNSKSSWDWTTWSVTTYYYKAKYNKDNKLTYRVIKKKNSNNKLTYNAYYKIVDNKIVKKLTKNKYYNNSNIFGNKNIKSKIVYTWNSAGQLKSNKNGKAYKVVTKYNKNGKKVSKVKYKYNAKGKAKKVK